MMCQVILPQERFCDHTLQIWHGGLTHTPCVFAVSCPSTQVYTVVKLSLLQLVPSLQSESE